jgi:hypothetical protein
MRVRSWGEGGEIITGTGNYLREFVEGKYILIKKDGVTQRAGEMA